MPDVADIEDLEDADLESVMPWMIQQDEAPEDAVPIEPVEWHLDAAPAEPVGHEGHEVVQGECIGSIAAQYGLLPESLWKDESNDALRNARKDEYVLLPHDRVAIPVKTEREQDASVAKKHSFRRLKIPLRLRMVLSDEEDAPYADEPFVVEGDDFRFEGKTTGDGLLESWVPPALSHAKVSFPKLADEMEIEIGALDPVSSVAGVQARLNNLGYGCGPITGEMNLMTFFALGRFRADQKIAVQDGVVLDEPTLVRLAEVHGS